MGAPLVLNAVKKLCPAGVKFRSEIPNYILRLRIDYFIFLLNQFKIVLLRIFTSHY